MIIKDARKTLREDLTEQELAAWSTPGFLNYLSKRALTKSTTTSTSRPGGQKPVKTGSSIRGAAGGLSELKRKTGGVGNRQLEKGIKINVGGPAIQVMQ